MPAKGPAATVLPVARDTSRASLSSPNWRAVDSIIRRDLIEKKRRPSVGKCTYCSAFYLLFQPKLFDIAILPFASRRGEQLEASASRVDGQRTARIVAAPRSVPNMKSDSVVQQGILVRPGTRGPPSKGRLAPIRREFVDYPTHFLSFVTASQLRRDMPHRNSCAQGSANDVGATAA